MSRALPAVVGALALLLVPTATPATTQAQAAPGVESWIELELELIESRGLNPARASRALAHVSQAMHLAAPAGKPAVAGAASTVLVHFFPADRARIENAARAAIGSSRADRVRFALGVAAGSLLVLRAEHDRSDGTWDGTRPTGPGFWEPTPPGFLPPLEPLAGEWRMWNIRNGSQLRPPAPPAFGSDRFEEERDEVYEVWQNLTPDQKAIADFWADGPGTVTPPGHWNAIALDELEGRALSTREVARVFAALNTAQADAFIACWDAKYHYWYLRPVTAIRADIDDDWLPYVTTPPFPAYVSGHSSTSGAAATVLAAAFPDRAAELAAMADEAAISRLYGGIHFRSDNEAGLVLGQRAGARAVAAYGLRRQ
jgi:membrane-associated phospholipid phosphatase